MTKRLVMAQVMRVQFPLLAPENRSSILLSEEVWDYTPRTRPDREIKCY